MLGAVEQSGNRAGCVAASFMNGPANAEALADSVALVYPYRSADKTRAGKLMGELSPTDMAGLESALRQYLGL